MSCSNERAERELARRRVRATLRGDCERIEPTLDLARDRLLARFGR
jgi:hypothetical protein